MKRIQLKFMLIVMRHLASELDTRGLSSSHLYKSATDLAIEICNELEKS